MVWYGERPSGYGLKQNPATSYAAGAIRIADKWVAPRPAPGHSRENRSPNSDGMIGRRAGRSVAVLGNGLGRFQSIRTRVTVLRQTPCLYLSSLALMRTVLIVRPARPTCHRHSSILKSYTARIPLKGEGWGYLECSNMLPAFFRSPVREGTGRRGLCHDRLHLHDTRYKGQCQVKSGVGSSMRDRPDVMLEGKAGREIDPVDFAAGPAIADRNGSER